MKRIDVSRTFLDVCQIPLEEIFYFFKAGSSFTDRVGNEKDKIRIQTKTKLYI